MNKKDNNLLCEKETNTLISCNNITITYGTYEACKDVTFSVHTGDYIAIVGSNGSGKTTLVKGILGLLPIKSGTIERNCYHTGYLPQQNSIQRDFPASVFEIVLSGCINNCKCKNSKKLFHFFYSKTDKDIANAQIKKLNIEYLSKKSYRELSGGQQQRVLLARALCAAEHLLVLDEPVTGLDPVVTEELYSIIKKLNENEKLAVIMVSHDVQRAVQNATHILHMDNKPLFFGTTEEYKKTEYYQAMNKIEVCETHVGCSCSSPCKATHITQETHNV